ncbi:MAG: hypothetical protein JWM68_300 [Verrucomicrobiales bacterium]|nr:hypothetical protein [Verrucomicrobiales bacterium]
MRTRRSHSFLGDLLADEGAKRKNYILTRHRKHAVFRKLSIADGFFYLSVRVDAGMNLVVKPSVFDNKMQIVSSTVVKILEKRRFGIFDYTVGNPNFFDSPFVPTPH